MIRYNNGFGGKRLEEVRQGALKTKIPLLERQRV